MRERAIGLSYLYLWYIYRVYQTNGYKCLSPANIRRGELKNIVSCRVKYEEGFVQIGPGRIITKPELLWTTADKAIIIPTDYSLCIGFSLQSGTLLLLQCFWNYLIKLVAGARFMSSKEFKVYIIWTIASNNLSLNNNKCAHTTIIESFIISMLGVVSHFRFRRLLNQLKDKNDTAFMTHRIRYYQDLNLVLSVSLFLFSTALITLTADGLTETKKLNRSKFYSDFLICNVNVLLMAIWIIVILILHPKPETRETTTPDVKNIV
ncbi:hypothetical protein RO3G_07457 [Rhizopus delemar RA 99-880]|uniref:Uncharacterized protein n=1 Tax=Rhizopus delemar (strain RA 99-880 / ATCC MYA-4621 / FGSC 9543 / NRRL 43880) TaxID=246409 RepID=I1C2S2_RHIO9|nr:hypothetical protein RO3G_07457 [Rhizopus delemar RA 99-880]|eukprot:EIE82752.1 hypothetical protein RO3G_07457 [Rhizopus delemar RA 99-880]